MRAIALHNRDQFLSMLRRALTRAVHAQKDSLDPRTHKTLEQMLYAIIITGTTRLNRLAQFLLPLRQARRALYVEKALSATLQNARYNETALFHAYSRVVYQALPTQVILGTTLRVETLAEAQEILCLYEKRWVIETGFEMLKGSWGLEKFMVRQWRAAERLLNLVAMAFALLIVLMQSGQRKVRALLAQAVCLLEARAAFKTLTVGKLREALALDLDEHHEAWYALYAGFLETGIIIFQYGCCKVAWVSSRAKQSPMRYWTLRGFSAKIAPRMTKEYVSVDFTTAVIYLGLVYLNLRYPSINSY